MIDLARFTGDLEVALPTTAADLRVTEPSDLGTATFCVWIAVVVDGDEIEQVFRYEVSDVANEKHARNLIDDVCARAGDLLLSEFPDADDVRVAVHGVEWSSG